MSHLHATSELSEKFTALLLAALGLIDYNGEITVRAESLTNVVLHE
jgi:hypothetical protein